MSKKTEVVRLEPKELSLIQEIRELSKGRTIKPKIKYDRRPLPLFFDKDKSRVLVIGDLHAPFDLDQYLIHCQKVYKDFNCNTVIFIGDIIDNAFSSFHEIDPDGYGAGEELERAIARVARWYEAFPVATVILGNHDRLIRRKAFSGGIPKDWIKEYSTVLNTPHWTFTDHVVVDDVMYIHGEGGTARMRIKSEHQSIVQGHLHTQAYIDWIFNAQQRIFGMQVGTGIDFSSYSFAYAKRGKKPAVSCGVVINGIHPFLLPMNL